MWALICRESKFFAMIVSLNQGFTLIELMVVVAIIGLIAAIAIPGFQSYVHDSKIAEAKVYLNTIQKGALSYYHAEHYTSDGMSTKTRVYPTFNSITGIGQAASDETIGIKFSPDEFTDGFNSEPWPMLKFHIISPFYYYYMYDANNTDASTFQASASSSLTVECDAIFVINGYADGSISAVMDVSGDLAKCNTATAP